MTIKLKKSDFYKYLEYADIVFSTFICISFQHDFFISLEYYLFFIFITIIVTFVSEIIKKSKNLLLRGAHILAILFLVFAIFAGIKSTTCKRETIIVPLTGCNFSGIDCIFYRFDDIKCKSYFELTKYGKRPSDVMGNYNVKITYKRLYPRIYKKISIELTPQKTS